MCSKITTGLFTFILLSLSSSLWGQHHYPPQQQRWNPDSLGNQRAVLQVSGKVPWVKASVEWRNRHVSPNQELIIVDSTLNKPVEQVKYGSLSPEKGEFAFEATSGAGIYYVYYLPYHLGGRSRNYPDALYRTREPINDLNKVKGTKNDAKLLRFDAVDDFNRNDPMEVIATSSEVEQLKRKYRKDTYLIFPEDRSLPIKMGAYLPKRWTIDNRESRVLSGESRSGAFYAFQIGLWPITTALNQVQVTCTGLKNEKGHLISTAAFTCINTNGVSYTGDSLQIAVTVPKQQVQALWCGIQLPKGIEKGIYEGWIHIKPANAPEKRFLLKLKVDGEEAIEGDVDKPWLQTRLPWLNSTLAQENTVIKPYTPLTVEGDTAISLLGRKVILAPNGFPKQIQTYFTEEMTSMSKQPNNLLFEPIHFHMQRLADQKDIALISNGISFTQKKEGTVVWKSVSTSDVLQMDVEGSLEFDGFLHYTVRVIALKAIDLSDIAMHIPYQPDKATYLMGLGQKGGYRPEHISWKWDVAHKNQDGAWIGNVNAGLQFSLRDEQYARPLNTNFYLQKPLVLPQSWGNENKGGIDIGRKGGSMLVNSYSGKRHMQQGDTLYYSFNLLITPFHTLDTEAQWSERYFHAYKPVDTVKASGANVINIHHGNALNPYINYPFVATKEMKAYIDAAHRLGLQVKIYNTIREVSNRMYELYPVRSLGQEVFSPGQGKGYSWLQEHLDSNYIAAWYVPTYQDAAIINSGMNRWHNYYVEGMNWLVKHIGIDGIYLDDVAFDRVTMKRIKRVMTQEGHSGIIDLHSANQFNKNDGFNNSATFIWSTFLTSTGSGSVNTSIMKIMVRISS
ncbi:DUF6067 family protein [Olivibacter ginsenosidimutans]|uniref:DUF6067 family protein n=1 Tax=Olivibacter ginsenosidimutans TaxID=1176537 RepID=A0ABP9C225_9SPHI